MTYNGLSLSLSLSLSLCVCHPQSSHERHRHWVLSSYKKRERMLDSVKHQKHLEAAECSGSFCFWFRGSLVLMLNVNDDQSNLHTSQNNVHTGIPVVYREGKGESVVETRSGAQPAQWPMVWAVAELSFYPSLIPMLAAAIRHRWSAYVRRPQQGEVTPLFSVWMRDPR